MNDRKRIITFGGIQFQQRKIVLYDSTDKVTIYQASK